ncbi:MAG: Asp-tRNA(Asn)/Glu-tRNA(Gln) amidotransferase subunit GatC [Phycisphaerales bacterium]|nr:MAG: Asp-tRNA(Asn)/Glu-tRNA(Gln) amidotransferase subunit GatC [Phycisphaerales bacterium]
MGATIDEDSVRHIAVLSRLDLTDEEVAKFSSELSAIVDYVDQLNELDTGDVPPTAHVLAVHNVFRADEPAPSPGPNVVLANAPQRQDTFFKVPKVLDQDSA